MIKDLHNMKERIQQIMDREGMTPGRFADSIGIQRSALSHILNGRNNPSLDVMLKVLSRFDYLSTDWLLFGTGPMFKHQLNSVESNLSPSIDGDNTDGNHIDSSVSNISSDEVVTSHQAEGRNKQQVKEIVVKEVEKMRSVTKIMIFYSDNTFENFIPETPGKVSKL